jgi:hypothetical protein
MKGEGEDMGIAKGKTPPRYDKAFKEGAVKLVVEKVGK